MTSQGTAHGRFTRAVRRGHVLPAEIAARELGAISTSDALALVLLYQREGSEKFERAARRWVRRVQIDHSLRHREVELLRGTRARSARAFIRSRSMRCSGHVGSCDYRCRLYRRNLTELILYGIASAFVEGTVEDFYLTREEAEMVLDSVIADEPELEGMLWVEPFEFPQSLN
jgi:hypothetical protein